MLLTYSIAIGLIGLGFAMQTTTPPATLTPYLWTDVPDNSIIRVGKDYYMSSTTMHMNPGVPIMKSRDLVNWRLISYAYNTLGDNDKLALRNGKNCYGAGSWASSLRFHKGTFYVSTFSSTTGRTHIYSTRNPEVTPWHETSFGPSFHDHSLFFDDDGRVYLIYGADDIRIIELTSDLSGVKAGGVSQVLVPGASKVAGGELGLRAEGSQMFKIRGKYYLCNITWPKGDMRTEIIHRSDSLLGPYEGRVMYHHQGIAQGGLVDTPDGKWYAFLFQDHGAVGRIPYMLPVKWENGWPIVETDNQSLPKLTAVFKSIIESDDFNDAKLHLAWQWNHNPDPSSWSLSARPGHLRLTTSRVDSVITEARNTLTQRTFGPESSATTRVDISELHDGDYAGLTAFQKKYGFVGVHREGDAISVVMVTNESLQPVVAGRVPLGQKEIYLRVDCDFRSRADLARFWFSLDGKDWKAIGVPLHMTYDLPHFMGYRFGLFAFSTKSPGGHADFDFFHIGSSVLPRP